MGLVGRFALLAAGALLLLGFGLASVLGSGIEGRALAHATQVARGVIEATMSDAIGDDELGDGLEPATIARLDRAARSARGSVDVLRVKVWTTDGTVAYSDEHAIIGRRFPVAEDLAEALDGGTGRTVANGGDGEAEHVAEGDLGDLLEVYVPLYVGTGSRPAGAAESYISYAPVAAEIASARRRLVVTLAVGLVLLFAALLPIVATASRRLRRQVQENRRLALHDPLTDLPNRAHFVDIVDLGLARGTGHGAVMLVDLNGFKDINDTLGHRAGDVLLGAVADRLAAWLPKDAALARLGGDEFGVFLPGDRSTDAESLASGLVEELRPPFSLEGILISVDASAGIALAPAHGDDLTELLRRADMAMYTAKRAHRSVAVYDPTMEQNGLDALTMVSDLRRAIHAGELRLHYQPKADMATRTIQGVEALVRWQHPERGLLAPSQFISFAERSDLIGPLTAWVIDEALRQCRAWADDGRRLCVAVNLSQASLLDRDVARVVADALARHRVPSHALEIEVTESALAGDLHAAARLLRDLDALGVRITIDDYGTGFSSIAHLRELPVSAIKIDRSFVSGMLSERRDATIVRSTIRLARDLGINVVAEGVESRRAWDALERLGCRVAQGFFIGRPMPPDQALTWIVGGSSATPASLPDAELVPSG